MSNIGCTTYILQSDAFDEKTHRSDVLWVPCGIKPLVTDNEGVVHVDSDLDHHFELPRLVGEDRGALLGNLWVWTTVNSPHKLIAFQAV